MFSTSFSTIPRRFAVVRPIVAATVSPPLALALAVPVVAVPPILSPRSPASRPAADATGVVDPRRRFPAVVAARGASSSFKTSSSSNARSASSSSRRARARSIAEHGARDGTEQALDRALHRRDRRRGGARACDARWRSTTAVGKFEISASRRDGRRRGETDDDAIATRRREG
jgi:hypothetical protein